MLKKIILPVFALFILSGCLTSPSSDPCEDFDRQAEQDFLEQNAIDPDFETTESGLQYRIVDEGEGNPPTANSTVRVHYHGVFTNGEVFDSTQGLNPVQISLSEVIGGFREGLLLMNEGARYELVLPPDLAYGENPPSGICAGSVLIFMVELVEIVQ